MTLDFHAIARLQNKRAIKHTQLCNTLYHPWALLCENEIQAKNLFAIQCLVTNFFTIIVEPLMYGCLGDARDVLCPLFDLAYQCCCHYRNLGNLA